MSQQSHCTICGNTVNNKIHIAQEMMFGFRDKFEYLECGQCGCVQLTNVLADLAKYYPNNYYSFFKVTYKYNPLKIFLKKQMIKYRVHKKFNLIGKLFSYFYPNDEDFYAWFEKLQLPFDARILDVGCGNGNLLLKFKKSGYNNIVGVDPFIAKDIHYPGGVTIHKKSLDQIVGEYDLIIFNHSFEHMPDQKEVLHKVFSLLRKGGCVLISVPVAGTYAWRHYGVNWVQLDAPRHLFLHTVKSMKLLGAQAGFGKVEAEFNSRDFQFWGSEQYLKGIPLRDPRSYAELYDESLFSKQQMQEFREKAEALNKANDGDAVSFYLFKD